MCCDLIIMSRHVFTGIDDVAQPLALCIREGKIEAVVPLQTAVVAEGALTYDALPENLKPYADEHTTIMAYGDAFICAGLHDAHVHVFHSALYSSPLAEQFLGENEADCVARLAPLAARRDHGWLLAQGWREYRWNPPVLPSKHSLDAAYPDRPVALYSGDAHTLWLNTCAMETLGITDASQPPEGGSYDRDEEGHLTGIIRETAAMELMPRIVASFTQDELLGAYKDFLHRCSSLGLTALCDVSLMAHPGLDFVRDDLYKALLEREGLPVRIHMFPTLLDSLERFENLHKSLTGPYLQAPGLKQFYDGVSSQHTAYVKEPYTNARCENDCGHRTMPFEEMKKLVYAAAEKGYEVRVHTIGDQAIHEMLDIYEGAQELYGMPTNGHHTLEHLENFQPDDIDRVARLGVIASVQPCHITLDPGGPERDLGEERVPYMWPFATYLKVGALMAFGTDSPVVDVNPFASLYTAVTRKDARSHAPEGGWQAQECISMADALRAYTVGSAQAAGRTDIGTLAPGMWADFTVLDTNLLSAETEEEPERILETQVQATYVAGDCVFEQVVNE